MLGWKSEAKMNKQSIFDTLSNFLQPNKKKNMYMIKPN